MDEPDKPAPLTTSNASPLTLEMLKEIIAIVPKRPDISRHQLRTSDYLPEGDRNVYRLDCGWDLEPAVLVLMRQETLKALRRIGLSDADILEAVETKHQVESSMPKRLSGLADHVS